MSFKLSKNEWLVGIIVLNIILLAMNESLTVNSNQDSFPSGVTAQDMLRNSNLSITRLPNENEVSLGELLNLDSDCLVEKRLGRNFDNQNCNSDNGSYFFSGTILGAAGTACEAKEKARRNSEFRIIEYKIDNAFKAEDMSAAMSEKTKILNEITKKCELESLKQPVIGLQFSDDG